VSGFLFWGQIEQFLRASRACQPSRKRGKAPIPRAGEGLPGLGIERGPSLAEVSAQDHQSTPAAFLADHYNGTIIYRQSLLDLFWRRINLHYKDILTAKGSLANRFIVLNQTAEVHFRLWSSLQAVFCVFYFFRQTLSTPLARAAFSQITRHERRSLTPSATILR
jgi:hypothetical protein